MIKEVLDVMLDLAQEGMTMAVVSHEMGLPARRPGASSSSPRVRLWRRRRRKILLRPEARTHQAVPEQYPGALRRRNFDPAVVLNAVVSIQNAKRIPAGSGCGLRFLVHPDDSPTRGCTPDAMASSSSRGRRRVSDRLDPGRIPRDLVYPGPGYSPSAAAGPAAPMRCARADRGPALQRAPVTY